MDQCRWDWNKLLLKETDLLFQAIIILIYFLISQLYDKLIISHAYKHCRQNIRRILNLKYFRVKTGIVESAIQAFIANNEMGIIKTYVFSTWQSVRMCIMQLNKYNVINSSVRFLLRVNKTFSGNFDILILDISIF